MAVPELELLVRHLQRDARAFDEALQFALERHKKYWSQGDRKFNPHGFLALGPTAIAALAYEAQMPIEAESDYLPMAVVRALRDDRPPSPSSSTS